MNDKNFLNIHVLISHSPSCLNRDDMNMQKSAIFGGARRVRVSSQSLKRSIRESDYYKTHLNTPSDRTRDLRRLKTEYVNELNSEFSEDTITLAIDLIAGGITQKDSKNDSDDGIAVAPWVAEEVAQYCRILDANRETVDKYVADIRKTSDKKQRNKKYNALKKTILDNNQAKLVSRTLSNGIDIALSGRMATSGLMTSVDGAMALAHTITTHAVDADIDWFTAVDDLVEEEGDVGAGHLDTQEFSSGVFYRYASLNISQLQENLGDADRETALDIGRHLTHMLATVVPSAKQQSFAAHNLADVVVASFGDMPISLANAFEEPIDKTAKNGYLKPSAERLIGYWNKLQKGYGLDDEAVCFNTLDLQMDGTVDSLAELEAWVAAGGKKD